MKVLFKAKTINTKEWVEGSYHYSNDDKYHYILKLEKFLERDEEMSLHKTEVHIIDKNTVIQIL